MKKRILAGFVGGFALMLVACSESSSPNGAEKKEELVNNDEVTQFEKLDDLPNCTAKREGDEVYVEDDDAMYVCLDETWQEKSGSDNSDSDDSDNDDNDNDDNDNDDNENSGSSSSKQGYATEDDLPNCTAKREGTKAFVEDDEITYICRDGEWVDKSDMPPSYATEDDLPNCSENREGEKVWLEETEGYVVCEDRRWVPEGEEDDDANSSSSKAKSSTSTSRSSSSTEENSSDSEEDSASSVEITERISGSCSPESAFTLNGLGKNEATTFTFTPSTSGIAAKKYYWTFDEGASIAKSTDPIPSVSFSTPGTHTVTLVVNKGTESESKPITCSVKVTGTKVKGCGCELTTDVESPVKVKPSAPERFAWKVSGCTGAGPFTYSWDGDSPSDSDTLQKSIGTEGTYAPRVKITNSEEMDTTVTCASVTTREPPSAVCALSNRSSYATSSSSTLSVIPEQTFYFAPNSVAHILSSTEMTLTLNEIDKSITISPGSTAIYGTTNTTTLTAPGMTGTYPISLTYEGDTVCTATLTVEWPAITSTNCGITEHSWDNTHYFTPGSSFSNWNYDTIGEDLEMTLYQNNEELTSKEVDYFYNWEWYQITPPTESGTYTYRLDFHGNTVCEVEYTW